MELTDKELQDIDSFKNKHKNCVFTATVGGKFTYIITPTGLGNCIEIRCNACGKQVDITDISNW